MSFRIYVYKNNPIWFNERFSNYINYYEDQDISDDNG